MKLYTKLFAAVMFAGIAVQAGAVLPQADSDTLSTTTKSITPSQQVMLPEGANVTAAVNAFVVSHDAQGQEILTPIDLGSYVTQGNTVEYRGLFTNAGEHRVRKMTVSVSIPNGAELVGDIEPKRGQATADGNLYTAMPLRMNVNGQIQPIPLSYYQGLRWQIEDLGVGATAVVKYRAKIK
ncbi:hypothetical protein LU293_05725 [Moraxella nasovis]|uniref:hypothetical protein n=1 Tax=Moraxella nasovis TaxID=2904121 RepID=UPI001F61D609|nr:hypothetical protein [Moraxella nasovis]UNU72617.1 hypothetical protein LU293_05725 [Moraxella nasovis]